MTGLYSSCGQEEQEEEHYFIAAPRQEVEVKATINNHSSLSTVSPYQLIFGLILCVKITDFLQLFTAHEDAFCGAFKQVINCWLFVHIGYVF